MATMEGAREWRGFRVPKGLLSLSLLSPLCTLRRPFFLRNLHKDFSSFAKRCKKNPRAREEIEEELVRSICFPMKTQELFDSRCLKWRREEPRFEMEFRNELWGILFPPVPSYSSFIRLVSFYYTGKCISTYVNLFIFFFLPLFLFPPPHFIVDERTQARNTRAHTHTHTHRNSSVLWISREYITWHFIVTIGFIGQMVLLPPRQSS